MGANPRTCRSGDLKSQRKKSSEDEQEKKKKKKNQNWGVKTRDRESNAKRLRGGEIGGYHRLLER